MTVFTVTIVQGQYEDRTEEVLIFSSLEKVHEWMESYETPRESCDFNGTEHAIIKEIELDTNELISVSDSFILPVELPEGCPVVEFDAKHAETLHKLVESGLLNYDELDWKTKRDYDSFYPLKSDL